MFTPPIKSIFMAAAVVLFLAVIFLDQNSRPVPLKFIVGTPFNISLSFIIVISMFIGIATALAVILLSIKVRKKD